MKIRRYEPSRSYYGKFCAKEPHTYCKKKCKARNKYSINVTTGCAKKYQEIS